MADKETIKEKIRERAHQGKISCTEARRLAEEYKLEPGMIGELCDELKIKVYGCELGCF